MTFGGATKARKRKYSVNLYVISFSVVFASALLGSVLSGWRRLTRYSRLRLHLLLRAPAVVHRRLSLLHLSPFRFCSLVYNCVAGQAQKCLLPQDDRRRRRRRLEGGGGGGGGAGTERGRAG